MLHRQESLSRTTAQPLIQGARPLLTVAQFDNVTAGYDGKPIIEHVTLELRESETVALLGPNGSGKTTLIRLLTGQVKPMRGLIEVATGESGKRSSQLVPQDVALFPLLTARENCIVFAKLMGANWRESARLADSALTLTNSENVAHSRIDHLSGGYRRRINIAVALVGKPRLLILDEATVGVDAAGRESILRTIKRLAASGMSVLLITHDFSEAARAADRVLFLFDGHLVKTGSPVELLAHAFGDQRRVELRFAAPPDLAVRRKLLALGADSAGGEMSWFCYRSINDAYPEWLAAVNALPLQELTIRSPGLESVYDRLRRGDRW